MSTPTLLVNEEQEFDDMGSYINRRKARRLL